MSWGLAIAPCIARQDCTSEALTGLVNMIIRGCRLQDIEEMDSMRCTGSIINIDAKLIKSQLRYTMALLIPPERNALIPWVQMVLKALKGRCKTG